MPAPTLLKPAEVAALFGVATKTVREWECTGQLPAVRTPGGHRRYPTAKVKVLARKAGIPAKDLNRSLRGLA